MKIYITGVSGTGKTSIARVLNKKGVNAIDLDEISHWENKETKEKVELMVPSNDEWNSAHIWVCDMAQLKEYLDKNEHCIVLGHTANQDEYMPLMDKLFVLDCKPETIAARINSRTENDYGKHPADLARILEWQKSFTSWMESKGAEVIDGEKPLDEIVENIISLLK